MKPVLRPACLGRRGSCCTIVPVGWIAVLESTNDGGDAMKLPELSPSQITDLLRECDKQCASGLEPGFVLIL